MSDRYNKPDPGSTDWHIPLNENFENIGSDMDTVEQTAPLWGGYEIVFDDENPESETYVRLKTE